MFKKVLSMLLTIGLLLGSIPLASMEAGDEATLLEPLEITADLAEETVEDGEIDFEGFEDAIGEAQEAPAETEPETPAETEPEAPAEPEPEAPAETEPETPAETGETPDETEPEAPAETGDAPAAAETPAPAATPEVVEAAPAEAAKVENAEAAEGAETAVPELVLTKNAKHTMYLGAQLQLNLNGLTATKFASSKKKVAKVDANGLITAVAAGKAKITATISKKKKLTLTLTVVDPTKPTSVYLTKDGVKVSGTITANKGEPITLVPVAVAPGEAVTNFKWSSSKKKVATVSGGVVTPRKEGTTTITVKTTRGGKKKKLKVKVVDPYKATKVTLDKTGLVYMTVKSTLQLTATMNPANSTSTLKWSTSNKKIATVGKTGLVTAKKKGTATITVKTSTGKKAKVKIKVLAQAGTATGMSPEWVALAEDNTLNPGDLYTYIVAMNPINANADVAWTSDNPGVIRVENAYRGDDLKYLCEVRAVDLGYARLTATDRVSGLSQSVTLYVKPGSEPTSISFPNLNNAPMKVGEKRDIAYQVDPQDSLSHDANRATVSYDTSILTITYDSNNASRNCRGTMDYNLHITAKAPGTTTVRVTLKNGVTNSFTITVQ